MALTGPVRTLTALGYDTVPALVPLSYPGRPVPVPSLLLGDELLELAADGPAGHWLLSGNGARLDDVLVDRGHAPTTARTPVLAVGSNASPAQVAHKLARLGLPVAVPMVPLRVRGIGIGCSAHIGRNGYVAAAPYPDPRAAHTLVVSWLDEAQLTAVDATELPNYRRTALADPPLPGIQLYVSEHGVLRDPLTGAPRPGGGDQARLLSALMAGSPALRSLLGPAPDDWVRRAAASAAVREEGTRLLGGGLGPR
ncbi:hypothetical protein G3I40_09395 [Streptomyces sp. SID14478]|uniref:hypothetical protein n=1 Tax=Streptomyces sp. SID14478 TaxID=2706073 RepID=UPI0013DB1462|nr:hypothetical protein [Streptomyces sp. SID14478]NEB75437.1 hypothetical protein [Streptomyces sp. SID14478]